MSQDPLLAHRERFPILARCNYLVNHSLGAMPRDAYRSLAEYADDWAEMGVEAWGERWWALNGTVGDQFAALIHAPPGSISMHPNASIILSILLSAFDFSDRKRDRVVVSSLIFHTDYYVLNEMLPDHVELVVVESPDGIHVPAEAMCAAIDERTRFVLVNHVLFRSGFIMPVQAIAERATQVGAEIIVDGYHSVGIIPVDVEQLGVDYYIGGGLKWMCGGPGAVFLYVRPDRLPHLRPKITGWFAHQRPFDFEVAAIELRDDAYRMLNGTFPVASLYAVQPGIRIIGEVGVEQIRAKSRRQTASLYESASAAGFVIRSPANPDERGGMVVIDPPHSRAVSQAMLARGIKIDYRPLAGIRVAPHFYNSDEEVRAAVAAMVEILNSGEWKAYAGVEMPVG
ncbi:MAG: aminotransferase class V-fold PLP-dependent enzyme [Anaerolineaceae bacterium]|nr:aminotransferase class V-fold PLP-dependent enzyme [Anaerolineaceae bacterium]